MLLELEAARHDQEIDCFIHCPGGDPDIGSSSVRHNVCLNSSPGQDLINLFVISTEKNIIIILDSDQSLRESTALCRLSDHLKRPKFAHLCS